MGKNYITYAQSGVGNTYGSKAEKTSIIKDAIKSIETPNDKYVIEGIGGFAAVFDLGRLIEDRNYEEFKRGVYEKYGEKRAPYVLAAHWLSWRLILNEIEIIRRKHG